MMSDTASIHLPPLALYIHIPWCLRKCPYCDFNSHEVKGTLPVKDYVKALLEDLKSDAWMAQGRTVESIFFGGGTPSLLPNEAIADVLAGVEALVGIDPQAEITLEANPGALEHQSFGALRRSGVNRVSIGVQSFHSGHLATLGRIHSPMDADKAVARARAGGFDNINIDLMHGLPQQTLEQAQQDLAHAIALAPEHLSWYQLTIEPNTEFFSRPPALPDEDRLATIYQAGQEQLAAAGFAQYETSAYARAHRQSKHNLNYWLFGDYLAIGAGAHGKITLPAEGRMIRYRKTRLPAHYLDKAKDYSAATESIAHENLTLEFMMNALRLNRGFDKSLFTARTGLPWQKVAAKVNTLVARGLLEYSADILRPSPMGRQFLNNVLETFLS